MAFASAPLPNLPFSQDVKGKPAVSPTGTNFFFFFKRQTAGWQLRVKKRPEVTVVEKASWGIYHWFWISQNEWTLWGGEAWF